MPVNMSLPVSAAAPAAAASSPAANALAAVNPSSSPAAKGAGATAPGANPGNGADPSAAGNGAAAANGAQQTAANANNDPNAPGNVNPGDAFARLLEAQMGAIAAGQGGQTQAQPTSDSAADDGKTTTGSKSAKTQDQALSADPALLPNPALLALQAAQPVPQVQPQTAVDSGAAANAAASAVAGASAATTATATDLQALAQQPAQTAAASRMVAEDKLAAASAFALGKTGSDDALQKLPQQPAAQPTILPQPALQQQAAVDAQKTATVPNFTIPHQVGTPDWSKSVGDQMMAMVNLKVDSAHIQVNPPQLGPIEVMLKMDANNNAQVTFTADSAATRAALQDSLPRLHAMMAAGGIQLGDAQVSSGQSQRQQQGFLNSKSGVRTEQAEGEEGDTLASIKAARGVLSIFA